MKFWVYNGLDGALHIVFGGLVGGGVYALIFGVLFLLGGGAFINAIGGAWKLLLVMLLIPIVLGFTLGLIKPASASIVGVISNTLLFLLFISKLNFVPSVGSGYNGSELKVFSFLGCAFLYAILCVESAFQMGDSDLGEISFACGVWTCLLIGVPMLVCTLASYAFPLKYFYVILGIDGLLALVLLFFDQT
jgi:hypothetical protein